MRRTSARLLAPVIGVASLALALVAPTAASAANPVTKIVPHTTYTQNLYYNCGPTATEIALTTWGIHVSASEIAGLEGTTSAGTNSIANVTYGLNTEVDRHAGWVGFYRSIYITGYTATASDVATLKSNAVLDIASYNRGFVANVYGSAVDTDGHTHTYSGGHYLAVVGYTNSGDILRIADNANGTEYWMTTARLATWIAEKGYSI